MTRLDYDVPQRVRYAPSPTGGLHVGNARTALFNYLLARRTRGAFIVRIEDTDASRNRTETEAPHLEALHWLGLSWDEGPDVGGKYGPYRQSERAEIYRGFAQRLREAGLAYENEGALRFRIPPGKTSIDDLVKGTVVFENALIPDPVIVKTAGGPTYNFAASVDDALMEIDVVVRGDEHLPNTPVQMRILEALDLRAPRYAHVPLILNEQHQKLSKRHDTVSIEEFREIGIQPGAMVDHLALLGWSAPDGREDLTLDELAKVFSLERVQHAGAIFNEGRLLAFNQRALRKLPRERLTVLLTESMQQWGYRQTPEWIGLFIDAYGEELQTIAQARPFVTDLCVDSIELPSEERGLFEDPSVRRLLAAIAGEPDARSIPRLSEQFGVEKKRAYHAVRLALTGHAKGAPLALVFPLLGEARIRARIDAAGASGNRDAANAR
ncbi:MAG TPA: glutamate--tRNA ligase family protein [Candidatus Baltobacteraceae bacterium]|jgi:glutamyl/glutaminyl-tRNA synthetase